MIRKILPLFLLLSGIGFAQTTTTYNVIAPSSGVYAYPYRFFDIPLNGAEVNWLEVGQNTGCYGQTSPAVGFIYLKIGATALPCIPLVDSPGPISGSFDNGAGISGSYSFVLTTSRHCTGGKGGGCHSSYTITDGEVTVTE